MTAPSKAWVDVSDSQVDPDSPLDAQLMTGLRDDLIHLREWLGYSYESGAIQNHNHDGVNSALVPVGPNMLRNGSFELGGSAGWTTTPYTGGSIATNTTVPLDGATSLAFTSTVLANGGGYAISNEFIPVSGNRYYTLSGAIEATASTANVVFNGTIATSVLTASAPSSGTFSIGQVIAGTSVTAGSKITSFGTGTGGAGTYNLSASSTVGVSEAMTATASSVGVSAKAEIFWYDKAQSLISASTIYSAAVLPVTITQFILSVGAPSNARYMNVKITGGVPTVGSVYGTVYFDGLVLRNSVLTDPLFTTTITSAVSSIDVLTAVDWTAFDQYRIVMSGMHPTATGTPPLYVDLWARFSTNGSTFDAGSNYTVDTTSNVSQFTLAAGIDNSSGSLANAEMILKRPSLSGFAKSMDYKWQRSRGTSPLSGANGYGFYQVTTPGIAGIRIMFSSGNIDLGSVAIFGEKDS